MLEEEESRENKSYSNPTAFRKHKNICEKRRNTAPGHHLFLFIGGVTAAADWTDGSGQEVKSMVFKVLIHQRQNNLNIRKTTT